MNIHSSSNPNISKWTAMFTNKSHIPNRRVMVVSWSYHGQVIVMSRHYRGYVMAAFVVMLWPWPGYVMAVFVVMPWP